MALVHFTIDPQQSVKAISRYIYGVNESLSGAYGSNTLQRLGGNRWTAYNWENNASNAGSDYFFQNDDYLGGGNTPGGALIPGLQNSSNHNAGTIVTIPINGYVAADKLGGGDVRNSGADYLETRFHQELARKGSAFSLTPNAGDDFVYADEFVNWIKTKFPYGQSDPNRPIYFSLDNEPDLWQYTHEEVHPDPVTYAELVQKTIAYASAIKSVVPKANVFGPANYGFTGYVNLQFAPDANGRDFQEYYLQQLKQAEATYGHRLIDTLDVHWYPEAQGGGVRITGTETSPEVVAARLQAPRSLWDPTYTEQSWIADYLGGPVELLPLLKAKINANYPGTKLAITEYNYGGGQHISGGIAQADVLGIFGRDGVFAANEWRLKSNEAFIGAAFQMYRNFDGAGGTFGNLSVKGTTDNVAASSIYASIDSNNRNVMTLVCINKMGTVMPSVMQLAHVPAGATADIYRLTGAMASPQHAFTTTIADPTNFNYSMPGYSVSTIRITWPSAKPVIGNFGSGVSYTENAAPVAIAAAATVTDVDSGNFAGGKMTAQFTTGGHNEDRLLIRNAGGVTTKGSQVLYSGVVVGSFEGGTGLSPLVINWNAAATPSRVQAVLRQLCYRDVSDNPLTNTRTVRLTTTDGDGGVSAAVTKTITVTAVNDAPTISIGGDIGYQQNTAAVLIAQSATVFDVDSSNFGSGKLTVSITSGANASNRLQIGGPAFSVDSSNRLLHNGTVIGTLNANYGVGITKLKVSFNWHATAAIIQELVRALRFRTIGSTSTVPRTVAMVLTDGDGGTSATVTKRIALSAS
jgi:hypothetical protein